MTDIKAWLEARGFRLIPEDYPLPVYRVEGELNFYLIDSAYEFDYVNEEAVLYMLSTEQAVLVHVPLLVNYEEYLESFRPYEGLPIHFLLQAAEDGPLFEANAAHYLEKMQKTTLR